MGGVTDYRAILLDILGGRCACCGYTPDDVSVLEIDHIDGNPENNTLSNLQALCVPCHKTKTHGHGSSGGVPYPETGPSRRYDPWNVPGEGTEGVN